MYEDGEAQIERILALVARCPGPLQQQAFGILLQGYVDGVAANQTPAPGPDNGLKININTATVEDFRRLPRVGPTLAERIVASREEAGGFTTVDELTEVPGITQALLDDLRPFVTV